MGRGVRSGDWRDWELWGLRMLMGSMVKGSEQYCENMVTMMLQTISNFVLSVAVISRKTSVVLSVILLWLPLMMGGSDSTVLLAS